MRIKTLSLYNFRNFEHVQEVDFSSAPLLIAAAPNATGKTNFLEAMVVLLRGRSFRGSHGECVRWGEDMFLVQGVAGQDSDNTLSVQYHASSGRFRVEENGQTVSPVTFYSHYPYILFLPEDTFMFHRGPAVRRNFLNAILITSPQYLSALVQYHRVLRQRNAALKEASSVEDVSSWTSMLEQYAEIVWKHRESFVEYLHRNVSQVHAALFGEEYDFLVSFTPGAPGVTELGQVLRDSWAHESRYRYTLYGPHKDDIKVSVAGKPVSSVLSRGQMRGVVISLKVAAHAFMKQAYKQPPLLMFDEVLSELDEKRQRTLIEHLPSDQMLLTSTGIPNSLRRKSDVHMLDLQSIIREGVHNRHSLKVS